MKIYIVTDGEYSDYRIKAVFTVKKNAERYASIHRYDFVEEWEADEVKVEGNVDVCVVYTFSIYREKFSLMECKYTNERISKVRKLPSGGAYVYVTLDEGDKDKAKKVAEDLYAQWKYEQVEKGGAE